MPDNASRLVTVLAVAVLVLWGVMLAVVAVGVAVMHLREWWRLVRCQCAVCSRWRAIAPVLVRRGSGRDRVPGWVCRMVIGTDWLERLMRIDPERLGIRFLGGCADGVVVPFRSHAWGVLAVSESVVLGDDGVESSYEFDLEKFAMTCVGVGPAVHGVEGGS